MKHRVVQNKFFLRRAVALICIIMMLISTTSTYFLIKNFTTSHEDTPSETDVVLAETIENSPNSKFTVCLDPGHGGYDEGCHSSNGILEKNLTLSLATLVGDILKTNGLNVVYTRDSDSVPWPSNVKKDLAQRVDICKTANSTIFVSIHFNSDKNNTFRGTEVWTRFPNTDGDMLSKSVLKELSALKYTQNRGIKYESQGRLKVLKENSVPSTLLELGFLSNKEDLNFISSENGKKSISEAIAKGIMNYFSK